MSDPKVFTKLKSLIQKHILGQEELIDALIMGLLADGHLLVEGAPGLAKTKAIQSLSKYLDADFQRIQFTPDLLPSDITGTEIYRPQTGEFIFQKGPIFHNLILADEINRAPAKVQAALLEAMAEKQVSVGGTTYKLHTPFLVMATQNPIEQEGTYPLPEAQLDRFMMHVLVDYPSATHELQIMRTVRQEQKQSNVMDKAPEENHPKLNMAAIFQARQQALSISMHESVEEYIVEIIQSTRTPERYSDKLAKAISFGASPRATLAMDRCARVNAWLAGRDYVTPDDVQKVAPQILRHRIGLSFQAEAQGLSAHQVVTQLIMLVSTP
ncbi:MAG: MoxR family ATPase [Pseudomonadota bacterium]|nr:MoxR family ATPase [Pseudomonadota bacterium]